MASDTVRRAFAACLAIVLAACARQPDDQTQIEQTLGAMTEALEAGAVADFMAPVAEDFIGANGRLDRRTLALLVRRERLARDDIRIQRLDTDIELIGQARAVAEFRALATGGTGLLPDEGRLWRVETGWRRDGGDWKLISAEWR